MQPTCRTCDVLLIVLSDAKDSLNRAMSRMRMLIGTGRRDESQAALREAQSLRLECQAMRAEVGRIKQRTAKPSQTWIESRLKYVPQKTD